MTGLLALADGTVFGGVACGAEGLATGEVVFNTSTTGYQEIATDPSYAGQVVVMTTPHVGNYGTNPADLQSDAPSLSGFVVRSIARRASNWRSRGELGEWFSDHEVVVLSEVDTRRLTRHVREMGAMPAAIGVGYDQAEVVAAAAKAPAMAGRNLTALVSTPTPYRAECEAEIRGRLVAYDFGIKRDILRAWNKRGFSVEVVPATTSADDVMAQQPDGVFLSNGPGDPEPLEQATEAVQALLGRVPIFGICLGHQVLGLALGADSYKLPFGHHGGNHPVRRLADGKVEITSQNHGFAIDLWSLTGQRAPRQEGMATPDLLPSSCETGFGEVVATHQNLNDGTLEGMALRDAMAFSVQFHPEAGPGPHDAEGLFDDFVDLMESANA